MGTEILERGVTGGVDVRLFVADRIAAMLDQGEIFLGVRDIKVPTDSQAPDADRDGIVHEMTVLRDLPPEVRHENFRKNLEEPGSGLPKLSEVCIVQIVEAA